MRRGVWFHGTPNHRAAEGIAIQGIRADLVSVIKKHSRRGHTIPVKGRVYLTNELRLAAIHAIGGDMAGSTWRLPKGSERMGYVFAVDGRDLADVQPDEDSVGEIAADALAGADKALYKPGKKIWREDPDFMASFAYVVSRDLTPMQIKKINDGYYNYFASGGKRLLRNLPIEAQIKMIEAGAHIAHADTPLHPYEAWAIDKTRVGELHRDYLNFFEVAENVWP